MGWKNKEVDYTGASAHDYIDSYTNRPEDMGSLEGLQSLLGGVGMVPGIGEPADLLNAILYGAQGKGGAAGLSLLSMLPFLGGAIKPGKKALKKAALETEIGDALDRTFNIGKRKRGTGHPKRQFHEGDDIIDEMEREAYESAEQGSFFKNYIDDLFESFKGKEF